MKSEVMRLLIADDDLLVREVLLALVAADPSIEVVGIAEDAPEAIDLVAKHHPDAALLDVTMPSGGGGPLVGQIKKLSPGTAVIALSAHDGQETIDEVIAAGASRFLMKGMPHPEILAAIKEAVDGAT